MGDAEVDKVLDKDLVWDLGIEQQCKADLQFPC